MPGSGRFGQDRRHGGQAAVENFTGHGRVWPGAAAWVASPSVARPECTKDRLRTVRGRPAHGLRAPPSWRCSHRELSPWLLLGSPWGRRRGRGQAGGIQGPGRAGLNSWSKSCFCPGLDGSEVSPSSQERKERGRFWGAREAFFLSGSLCRGSSITSRLLALPASCRPGCLP